jgi:hypothetical protein
MQKVEGSGPFIRSRKALETGPFLFGTGSLEAALAPVLERIWKDAAARVVLSHCSYPFSDGCSHGQTEADRGT